MAHTSVIVKKSNTYYCIPAGRGPLGLGYWLGQVKEGGNVAFRNDEEIGQDILDALSLFKDDVDEAELDEETFEKSVIALGFKDARVFKQNARLVFVEIEAEQVRILASKRRRGPYPGFEFIGPDFLASHDPAEVGRAFRKALALSH